MIQAKVVWLAVYSGVLILFPSVFLGLIPFPTEDFPNEQQP